MTGRSHATKPPRLDGRLEHTRVNRSFWERQSNRYDRKFRDILSGDRALAWGVWRIPEAELDLLGPVRGKRILEFGCGAARWAAALARQGAAVVGLDQSAAQLRHALRVRRQTRAWHGLVRANAERTPFRAAVFDTVFCDWGAMTFCDPYRTIPEVARILRRGGRFVFATHSPIYAMAAGGRPGVPTGRLHRSYFGLHRFEDPGTVEFQLPYGKWIDLFRDHGFQLERLLEPEPRPMASTLYLTRAEERWSRKWPREAIWQLRKSRPVARSSRSRPGPTMRRVRGKAG